MRPLRCPLQVYYAAVVVLCLTVTPTIVTSVAAQETVIEEALATAASGTSPVPQAGQPAPPPPAR